MAKDYAAESIESLDYFEHIRRYPGMYIGSKDEKGLLHCVKEILSNSIDEYLNGAGTRILVVLKKDGSIYIEDDGRGIPHGTHPSGCSILQACYGIANTGGKFNNATGESGYNTSGGEHGTGCKAVNALSIKMIATTARDGVKEIVEFSKGEFVDYKQEKSNENGVTVQFWPDGEIFETTKFDFVKIKTMMQEFSFLCSGLRFVLSCEGESNSVEFFSKDGLTDYINYLNKGQPFLFKPIYLCGQDGSFQVEAIIGYNEGYSGSSKLYTNNIPQEKGTHLTGFKTAWTSTLNTWARDNKILKDKDNNFSGTDLEEGQMLILNFKMIDPVFKGQNKEELSSSEGRTYVQRLITQELRPYLDSHAKDIKILLDKALNARKAREAAKKAREAVRNADGKKKPKLPDVPTKLVDATSKDRTKCEIFIVEGDSAAGGLVKGRTAVTQAVFPIRGKIINALKTTVEKVLANAEVINLKKALGLDLSPTGRLLYDKKKLRYDKIVIATDADPDGQAIRNLLLTLFWWWCPDLILNGHIYIALPPLFRITTNRNKYIYLKDAAALDEYKEAHKGEKYLINRNKGLGEQDPEELSECLLDEKTRNMVQIVVNDQKAAEELFETLMGTSVPPRRAWLLEHSEEARGEFDV